MALISGNGWFAKYVVCDKEGNVEVTFRPIIAFTDKHAWSEPLTGIVPPMYENQLMLYAHEPGGLAGYVTADEKASFENKRKVGLPKMITEGNWS